MRNPGRSCQPTGKSPRTITFVTPASSPRRGFISVTTYSGETSGSPDSPSATPSTVRTRSAVALSRLLDTSSRAPLRRHTTSSGSAEIKQRPLQPVGQSERQHRREHDQPDPQRRHERRHPAGLQVADGVFEGNHDSHDLSQSGDDRLRQWPIRKFLGPLNSRRRGTSLAAKPSKNNAATPCRTSTPAIVAPIAVPSGLMIVACRPTAEDTSVCSAGSRISCRPSPPKGKVASGTFLRRRSVIKMTSMTTALDSSLRQV